MSFYLQQEPVLCLRKLSLKHVKNREPLPPFFLLGVSFFFRLSFCSTGAREMLPNCSPEACKSVENRCKSVQNQSKMLTFKGPGSLVWSPGSLLRAGATLGTLGNSTRSEKGVRGPPPTPLRRVTFWLLLAKYSQKCDFMLMFCTLFPVLLFEAKMDPLKEG